MIKIRLLSTHNLLLAIVFSLIMSACSWPWPGAITNTNSLGDSPISDELKKIWMSSEKSISEEILKLIKSRKKSASSLIDESDIEVIGAVCEKAKRICHYSGSIDYELTGLPDENKSESKRHVDIEVFFDANYSPPSVVTKKNEFVRNN